MGLAGSLQEQWLPLRGASPHNVLAAARSWIGCLGTSDRRSGFSGQPCSIPEPCTSDLQVTGDPNVPASKVTLYTLDAAPTVGRYHGYEEDADGTILPDRPIGAAASPPILHHRLLPFRGGL